MTQLSKTLCYCRETSINIFSSLSPYDFKLHKKTKKIVACPSPAPPAQQQHPSKKPKPVNGYSRKTRYVNCKVCQIYSFQHLIVLDNIHSFYPVDLLTRLCHPDHTKIRWVQSTCLCIYASLDEAKNDPSYPVWSVVNTRFLRKHHSCWGTAVACFWNNFFSTISLPVQCLTDKKPSFDFLKFFLLIVVLLKINDRYGNGWNKILFEDWFGDG